MSAKFGRKFTETLIQRVRESKKMKVLFLWDTLCGDTDVGQELGLRLVEVISANNTIERLNHLYDIDLLVSRNIEQWGESLTNNNALAELHLKYGCGRRNHIRIKTRNKRPHTKIRHLPLLTINNCLLPTNIIVTSEPPNRAFNC